jgi:hypothetical protein
MIFAASLFFIVVATLMFLGWGWAFLRVVRVESPNWPTTVALGTAVVVFIGGLLNLARLAYPISLALVGAIGVILATRTRITRLPILIVILIAAVMIFTIATQLPPSIYNFHDDYQKYFAYPIRMIETGTVFGSPLSAIGLQTLGAQAFLDGFVVGFFPIKYVNAVDAVFGLFLCLLLASQFAKDRVMSVVCVLSVVFINPQYVNISTLFCGSALIMAMVAVEDVASLGLLYAALIAMKPIYAVFAAIHLLAISRFRWQSILRTGFAAVLFLSPWILVHAPNYLAALHTHHSAPTPVAGDIDTERMNLFSVEPLAYGSTAANYTVLVIALSICGVICWRARSMKAVAGYATAVATFLIFVYVFGPMQYGYDHGLRYFTPVAIGIAPAVFGLTAANRPRWLPILIAIVPLAAFAPSLRTRVATEISTHSAASYAWLTKDADYLEYNRRVLTGPEWEFVKSLQGRIPPGEPILAWINTPFYLDYKRNRILDIDTAGIGVPWSAIPAARYLIWDYAGFATADEDAYEGTALNVGAGERRDSMMTLDFIHRLNRMVAAGEVLFDDGKVKVVRLSYNSPFL